MPVYNMEKYVGTAIESILAQTYDNFELLIIDDASTDQTFDVISEYKDKRIHKVKNCTNIGIAASLNKGLSMINSQYVARMDADDISKPTRFEKQLAYMKSHSDLGILGSHMELINDNGVIIKEQRKKEGRANIKMGLFFGNTSLAHPSILIKKSKLDKYHLRYDSAYQYAEDYDLYCRASHYIEFDNYPECLIQYRVHSESVSQKFHDQQILDAKIALYLHLRRLKLPISIQNFNVHALLSFPPEVFTDDMKRELIEWIYYLDSWNKRNELFPCGPFSEYCKQYLHKIIGNIDLACRICSFVEREHQQNLIDGKNTEYQETLHGIGFSVKYLLFDNTQKKVEQQRDCKNIQA